MMRAKLVGASLALVLIAAPAMAEDWDFVLTNDTGKTVTQVELSPAGTAKWAAQRTDEGVSSEVKNGNDWTVHFDKSKDTCDYDVRLTFADKSTVVWTGLNVCDNAFAEFSYRNGNPVIVVDDD
ncbi:hypothetical protein EB810_07280 [Altererythrobacter sp. FM1]|uniref:Argininosuccinate lyase n=1 Tax=Tsuneonella flava TaxID=2055955 RepID=A0ABX7K5S7_9SPHN|nr:hypothetical protein [Tsuneonella flava]QSB43581.1 hypothetical protein IDJ81_09330 [Tsuneonella flava]ROT94941.1 hypothetical protein EB810_07280 [Altererythrobacter sp. FM1]